MQIRKINNLYLLQVITTIILSTWANLIFAYCVDQPFSPLLVTTGDLHLHGNINNVKIWKEDPEKTLKYSATFDTNARITSVKGTKRCDYTYQGKYLSEISIDPTGMNGNNISAAHFTPKGEPDIYAVKLTNNRDYISSSDLMDLITVAYQDDKVTYSTFTVLNDKPKLSVKTIATHQPNGFLSRIDSMRFDIDGNKIPDSSFAFIFAFKNGDVTQETFLSSATGLAVYTTRFDYHEFDACKNWLKRTAHETSLKTREGVSGEYSETREITYHTPCQ